MNNDLSQKEKEFVEILGKSVSTTISCGDVFEIEYPLAGSAHGFVAQAALDAVNDEREMTDELGDDEIDEDNEVVESLGFNFHWHARTREWLFVRTLVEIPFVVVFGGKMSPPVLRQLVALPQNDTVGIWRQDGLGMVLHRNQDRVRIVPLIQPIEIPEFAVSEQWLEEAETIAHASPLVTEELMSAPPPLQFPRILHFCSAARCAPEVATSLREHAKKLLVSDRETLQAFAIEECHHLQTELDELTFTDDYLGDDWRNRVMRVLHSRDAIEELKIWLNSPSLESRLASLDRAGSEFMIVVPRFTFACADDVLIQSYADNIANSSTEFESIFRVPGEIVRQANEPRDEYSVPWWFRPLFWLPLVPSSRPN